MLSGKQKPKEGQLIDYDERGNPSMTPKTVLYFFQQNQALQDHPKLYLQAKGFTTIMGSTLSEAYFENIEILWLNNNAITNIEGLNSLQKLTALYLSHNFISRIENLDELRCLQILDLGHNKLEMIEGLNELRKLSSINLSNNFITTSHSLQGLQPVSLRLNTLDLSLNELDNCEETFGLIIRCSSLICLYLKCTPISRGLKNYRKRFISSCKHLRFLDDRPVFPQDHILALAWAEGGLELEEIERQKILADKKRNDEDWKVRQRKCEDEQARYIEDSQIGKIQKLKEHNLVQKYTIIEHPNSMELAESPISAVEQMHQQNVVKIDHDYYQFQSTQEIEKKVHQILNHGESINNRAKVSQKEKWKSKYQPLLQALLMKYRFDFSQVLPSFNMIVTDMNKKMFRNQIRFELDELRAIWTEIETQRRKNRY